MNIFYNRYKEIEVPSALIEEEKLMKQNNKKECGVWLKKQKL